MYLAIGNWLVFPSCPLLRPGLRGPGLLQSHPNQHYKAYETPVKLRFGPWSQLKQHGGISLTVPSPVLHHPGCDSSVSKPERDYGLTVMLLTWALPRGTSTLGKLRPGKGNLQGSGFGAGSVAFHGKG